MSESPLFQTAQAGRASEDIALQIESAILNERLLPGDSLPSERDLQTQFGTGRGVIREAIRALKQKGLIEIRKGPKGGAYIKQLDVANISESLALFLKQQHVNPNHVAEFRESIDQSVALLAMSRCDTAQNQQLLDLVFELEQAGAEKEVDLAKLGELDRSLNLLIAQMAKNPIFEWVMDALQQGFSSHDYTLYEDVEFRAKTIKNWRATALHITNREPLKTQASISQHYLLLQACINKNH
jgi:GntR family transcriptional regulator, transcriptional repressor for pyruvate dehydrogenase complex